MALRGEPRPRRIDETWWMEERAHGDALRARQRRRTATYAQPPSWGKIRGPTRKESRNPMIINALRGASRALGKGEVDSSILSGSTSHLDFRSTGSRLNRSGRACAIALRRIKNSRGRIHVRPRQIRVRNALQKRARAPVSEP